MHNQQGQGLDPDHDFESGSWEYMKNRLEYQIHKRGVDLREATSQLTAAVKMVPTIRKTVCELEAKLCELREEEKMIKQANQDAREELGHLVDQSKRLQIQHLKMQELWEQEKEDWVNLRVEVSQMTATRTELIREKMQLQAATVELHAAFDHMDLSKLCIEFEQKEMSKSLDVSRQELTELRGEVRRLEIRCEESGAKDDKWTENHDELLKIIVLIQDRQIKLQRKINRYQVTIHTILDNKYDSQIIWENLTKMSNMQQGFDQCLEQHSRDMRKLKQHLVEKTASAN